MPNPELAQIIVKLIKSGNEGLTHDLKWDVDITDQEKQAELIRDVMSLANADPRNPARRYLVMNAQNAMANAQAASLKTDDATLQQIVNERVGPPIKLAKINEPTELGEVAVIVIENDYEFPYMVDKEITGPAGCILQRSECWTRSGSGKRRAASRDIRAMEAARAERGIGPSGLPNAEALKAAAPHQVGGLAGKVLDAEKHRTLIRAIKRVVAETGQVWRTTQDNKDDAHVKEMVDKLKLDCDWLAMVAVTAVDFQQREVLLECAEGLKSIYELALETALVRPLLEVWPRLYVIGAYAVSQSAMESVAALCTPMVVRQDRPTPTWELFVNDPMHDLLPSPCNNYRARFRTIVQVAMSQPVYDGLFGTQDEALAGLCQFDLLASVLTPWDHWENKRLAHYPTFGFFPVRMCQPLAKRIAERPELFGAIHKLIPGLVLWKHIEMVEARISEVHKGIPVEWRPFFADWRFHLRCLNPDASDD